ncbi:aldo-keto reductase [Vararia minispora EC-137]|uniref:Aldo-keto reductase n=1 Tax=Vararia minispora EC-137 TaxID=1314806 RepID=A0ACB8QLF1_9AGAM|nr:aldo-keto reductase [Vararia minispora EC-137]
MSTSLTLQSKKKLRDGNSIPVLGFGTYELEGREAYRAVRWALEAGYRHVDSAEWYENERECGQAILDFCKASGVPREEVFYTTKLKNNAGYAATRASIQRSLEECGLGYIDLYLIHGPWGGPRARREAWEAIIDAQKAGVLKSIGISTFGTRHMEELLNDGKLPIPSVHQWDGKRHAYLLPYEIDLHPFMTRTRIVDYCERHGISLEAWGSLARGMRMKHPSILELAQKYGKQPAHIFLRWSLQKGYIPLVKSASQERIIANTQIFDFMLTEEEVTHLDGLDESLVTDWNPVDCP